MFTYNKYFQKAFTSLSLSSASQNINNYPLLVKFQVGTIASFAIKPQSFSAFAVQMLFVGAASVMLSFQLSKGIKDFVITA